MKSFSKSLPVSPAPDADDSHPDAWQRFEKAVDIGLRTKPMHREPAKAAKSSGRVVKGAANSRLDSGKRG